MLEFIFVGVGGFIGSCLRFGITKLIAPLDMQFPLATLISNVVAGFLIGFLAASEREIDLFSVRTRLFLKTGILGGLSTFSAFSLETMNMLSEKKYFEGAFNITLNVCLCLIGVFLGMLCGKIIFKKISA